MKILYLHQYFVTPKSPGGTRSYEFAKRWVKEGHDIYILSGKTVDPITHPNQLQDVDGIKLRAIGRKYSSRMSYFGRSILFIQFMVRSVFISLFSKRPDLILATSTPLSIVLPALICHKIRNIPYVFEVRDVWPDAIIDAGLLKNKFVIKALRYLEITAYRNASSIVALSTGMRDRIIMNGGAPEKISLIPNCCDTELFKKSFEARLEKTTDTNKPLHIIYMGSINLANGMEVLLETIKLLRSENIMWHFVGDGNKRDYMEEQLELLSITNTQFYGWVKKNDIANLLPSMDLGIVSFINTPTFFDNSPNKFFDYISAGLPVLFTRSTWLEADIHTYQCGLVCNTATPGEVTEKIKSLMLDREKLSAMSMAARNLAVEKYSRESLSTKYIELLKNVCSRT